MRYWISANAFNLRVRSCVRFPLDEIKNGYIHHSGHNYDIRKRYSGRLFNIRVSVKNLKLKRRNLSNFKIEPLY